MVLNPFFVVLSFFLPSPALVTSRRVYLFSCLCSLVSVLLSLFSCLCSLSSKVAKARQRLGGKPPFVGARVVFTLWVFMYSLMSQSGSKHWLEIRSSADDIRAV